MPIKSSKKYLSKEEALKKLQHYCAYQDRCHSEVRSKLISLGIYGDDLEDIIVALIEEKFLDEERFARSFARGKHRFKHWGRNRIKQELKIRDISAYCIRKALEEIEGEQYEINLREFLERKDKLLKESNPFKRRKKLAQYAFYRGFETELVWRVVKELVP